MKVLSIGSSCLEITCPINAMVKEDTVLRLTEKTECGAGHAGNVAYLLGKWGIETYIASMLGSDDAGSKVKKEYDAMGIRVDYIETSFDKQTSLNLVVVNTTSKNKTVFEVTSNPVLKKFSFGIEPDIIVTDGSDYNAAIFAIDKFPAAKSFLLINRVSNEIMEQCKYANYIIFNRSSAEVFAGVKIDYTNSSTLVNVYNRIKQRYGKSEIIITLGERGCLYSLNGQVKIMPPVNVSIVDTNGAGDTFAGAFIYGIGRNFGLEKSIAYATIAASLSTTKLTSRLSIPSLTEVSNFYDTKFGAYNNPINQKTNPNGPVNDTIPNPIPSPNQTQLQTKTPEESAAQASNTTQNVNPNPTNMSATAAFQNGASTTQGAVNNNNVNQ